MSHIERIQNIAQQSGWMVECIYRTQIGCFIELLSLKSANIVFISLNSKYVDARVIDMELVETKENDDAFKKYYTPVEISDSFPKEERLELGYTISQKDEQNKQKRHLEKQYRRLKNCVQTTGYSIALLCAPFALFDDSHVFQSSQQRHTYRLSLVTSARTFMEKSSCLDSDCTKILQGVHDRLNDLEISHSHTFEKMINSRAEKYHTTIQRDKTSLIDYIDKYQKLLHSTRESEMLKHQEIRAIEQMADGTLPLAQDLRLSHQKNKLEKELRKIREGKRSIIDTLKELRSKYDSTSLLSDALVFENLLMLDTILDNFEKLNTLHTQQ